MINKKQLTDLRIKNLYLLLDKLKITEMALEIIKKKQKENLETINEALTHTSHDANKNHERLEFLGDAVLRLAATEFIERNFPKMQVGERSELRSQLVSDEWLMRVGKAIEIEKYCLVGKKTFKDSSALDTILAETTEALIGALFECFRDLVAIDHWLCPYWLEESKSVLQDPHKKNPKSALQEWTQSKRLPLPNYETQEISKEHGSMKRFCCHIKLSGEIISKGWGKSIKAAEKSAAKFALASITK